MGWHPGVLGIGGHWDSPTPPPLSPPPPPSAPPEPPAFPPPLPPPGNPGTLHFGLFFWPLLVVGALSLAVTKLVPRAHDGSDLDLILTSKEAILKEATISATAAYGMLKPWAQESTERVRSMTMDERVEAVQALTPRLMAELPTLRRLGLLSVAALAEWGLSLSKPLHAKQWMSKKAVLGALQRLTSGFALLNAIGFWLEVLGFYGGFAFGYVSADGLLDHAYLGLGAGLYVGACLELLVAALVSYLLYWMTLHGEPLHTLGALCAYALLGASDLVYLLSCLFGGLEPLRALEYAAKGAVALGCAFYAFKIRERAEGRFVKPPQPEPDDDDFEDVETTPPPGRRLSIPGMQSKALPEPAKLPAPATELV